MEQFPSSPTSPSPSRAPGAIKSEFVACSIDYSPTPRLWRQVIHFSPSMATCKEKNPLSLFLSSRAASSPFSAPLLPPPPLPPLRAPRHERFPGKGAAIPTVKPKAGNDFLTPSILLQKLLPLQLHPFISERPGGGGMCQPPPIPSPPRPLHKK